MSKQYRRKSHNTGTVYLLHFERPYRHSRHYVGFTNNLEQRLSAHRSGLGARLMTVIAEAGIGFELARTWEHCSRRDERLLKQRKATPRLCPICDQRAMSRAKLDRDALPFSKRQRVSAANVEFRPPVATSLCP